MMLRPIEDPAQWVSGVRLPALSSEPPWAGGAFLDQLRGEIKHLMPEVCRRLGHAPIITLDGESASGKSTAAKHLADLLGLTYLDSGALYRSLAYYAQTRKPPVPHTDGPELARLVREEFRVRFERPAGANNREWHGQTVILTTRLAQGYASETADVTKKIRSPHVAQHASKVSRLPEVREALHDLQRSYGRDGVVTCGRDMGTTIFPAADVKFFFSAQRAWRAILRTVEEQPTFTIDLSRELFPQICGSRMENIRRNWEALGARDEADRSNPVSPMLPAPDAIRFDSTNMVGVNHLKIRVAVIVWSKLLGRTGLKTSILPNEVLYQSSRGPRP